MNELIKSALDEAYELVQRRIPQTKSKTIETNIDDVAPINIPKFMQDNGIPDDAWLYCPGEESIFNSNTIFLCHNISVPTTPEDQLRHCRERFKYAVFPILYKKMIAMGFKRRPVDSDKFRQYSEDRFYDLYTSGNLAELIEYYSLFFTK